MSVLLGYCPECQDGPVQVHPRSGPTYICVRCQHRAFRDRDSYRAVLRELRPRRALQTLTQLGWAVPNLVGRVLAISRSRGDVEILVQLSDGRQQRFALRYAPPLPGLDVDLDEVPW